MRLAGNKLRHLRDYYHSELKGLHESGEIDAIFGAAVNHFLGFSKTEVFSRQNENINQSDLLNLYDCCKELKTNKPLQYVLEEAWFYGMAFYVNPTVLIPRPETEELVESVVKQKSPPKKILDIGTGSGCIAIALKKNIPGAKVYACDISEEALQLANKNALKNNVEINFIKADVLNTNSFLTKINQSFDVIISNPPYVLHSEKSSLAKHVVDFEPALALFVNGDDGIVFYKKIVDICYSALNEKGVLYFELNPITASEVRDYTRETKQFSEVELSNDMSGKRRFLRATKK